MLWDMGITFLPFGKFAVILNVVGSHPCVRPGALNHKFCFLPTIGRENNVSAEVEHAGATLQSQENELINKKARAVLICRILTRRLLKVIFKRRCPKPPKAPTGAEKNGRIAPPINNSKY